MYKKGVYKNLGEEDIKKQIKKEGFDPLKITDPPGRVYSKHKHPETKLLAFLSGDMEVISGGRKHICKKGDKLVIPGNTYHSAVVGDDGAVFFWSEKLLL